MVAFLFKPSCVVIDVIITLVDEVIIISNLSYTPYRHSVFEGM